ncbi:hypothetical protein BDZ89DRAFT_1155754 [Hymenopellis radicata]|nr:hypothetical protein BDZ89DRAFT_1155754 [Hymenopellis radicata]
MRDDYALQHVQCIVELVLTALSLDEAIRDCDTFVLEKIVHGDMALARAPASYGQIAFITWRWKIDRKIDPELRDSVTKRRAERLEKLTKGEAANLIIRLKHGAMAIHRKKAKAAAQLKQLVSKEKERRSRANVSVGPLHAN